MRESTTIYALFSKKGCPIVSSSSLYYGEPDMEVPDVLVTRHAVRARMVHAPSAPPASALWHAWHTVPALLFVTFHAGKEGGGSMLFQQRVGSDHARGSALGM